MGQAKEKPLGAISDFAQIKRKSFEQMCREDYGIEPGKEYVLEVLEDIEYEHLTCSKEDPIAAKFLIRLKKGVKLRWLADSNKRIVKLRFEGDTNEPDDVVLNEGEFNHQRMIETTDGKGLYRVRTNEKKFGKSTLKKGGTIKIPASFFWVNFHMEKGDQNIRIEDSEGKLIEHVKDRAQKIVAE